MAKAVDSFQFCKYDWSSINVAKGEVGESEFRRTISNDTNEHF